MSREDQAKVLCAGGSLFRKLQVEHGLLILAFVLRAISERAFQQSLLMSKGSPVIFFRRPISCALMAILLALMALQVFFMVKKRTETLDQFRGAGDSNAELGMPIAE